MKRKGCKFGAAKNKCLFDETFTGGWCSVFVADARKRARHKNLGSSLTPVLNSLFFANNFP
jgi:hypothetical protein